MVTTRRQSRGESIEQHESSPAVPSSLKRERPTVGRTNVRKRTRLNENHETLDQNMVESAEDGPTISVPPSNANSLQTDGSIDQEATQEIGTKEERPRNENPLASEEIIDSTAVRNEPLPFRHAHVLVVTNGVGNARHKRFDSEEPLDPPTVNPLAEEEVALHHQSEQDNDSDEDAPDDVTAAAAQAQLKLAKAEALYAAEQQKLKRKRRRQEQDVRLKKQSKPTDKEQSASLISQVSEPVIPQDGVNVNQLPELLPDSILDEVPDVRPPTPEPKSKESRTLSIKEPARRKIILDQHPEDVQVGPVNVRVLEKVNRHLPPVANKKSKSLRDRWLVGKRGHNSLFSQRKPVGANAGFLRR